MVSINKPLACIFRQVARHGWHLTASTHYGWNFHAFAR